MGNTSLQVNVFSGHSNLTDTSSRFYLHQTKNWLGFKLAAPLPAPPALPIPRIDNELPVRVVSKSVEGEPASSDDDSSSADEPDPAQRKVQRPCLDAQAGGQPLGSTLLPPTPDSNSSLVQPSPPVVMSVTAITSKRTLIARRMPVRFRSASPPHKQRKRRTVRRAANKGN